MSKPDDGFVQTPATALRRGHQFDYTFEGRPYTPRSADDREVCGLLDETVLAGMVYSDNGVLSGGLPVQGLRTVMSSVDLGDAPAQRLARARHRDDHSVAALVQASQEFAATVGAVIARRVEQCGYRHLGIFLSGGLDSGLLVHICAGLKRRGLIEQVSAFHFTSPDVPEMAAETAVARLTCAHNDVPMYEIPEGLAFGDLSRFCATRFPFPCQLGYEYGAATAAAMASQLGVDALMNGVGSELSTTTNCSTLAEIEQLTTKLADADRVQQWPITVSAKRDDIPLPFWIADTLVGTQAVQYSEPVPVPATAAMQLAFDQTYRDYCTFQGQEHLRFACSDPEWPLWYTPYLEPDVLVHGAGLPSFMHTLRCGGEVYEKALIRVALRDLPPAVFLRSRGSPDQATQQHTLRNEWPEVIAFWNQPSHLADRGLIDIDAIRQSLDKPATLLRTCTSYGLSRVMLLEAWLRHNPHRLPPENPPRTTR